MVSGPEARGWRRGFWFLWLLGCGVGSSDPQREIRSYQRLSLQALDPSSLCAGPMWPPPGPRPSARMDCSLRVLGSAPSLQLAVHSQTQPA